MTKPLLLTIHSIQQRLDAANMQFFTQFLKGQCVIFITSLRLLYPGTKTLP